MINEHLDKTIATLISDADFLSDFPEKLRSFNDQDKTIEDQKAMIKRAAALILHIIDYCVTSSVIDMDADISRYCQRFPAEAKKLREKLNMAGLSLKENYQYLFKDGTAVAQDVTLGEMIGDRVEVLSGLEDGDEIIVSGIMNISDGTKVRSIN